MTVILLISPIVVIDVTNPDPDSIAFELESTVLIMNSSVCSKVRGFLIPEIIKIKSLSDGAVERIVTVTTEELYEQVAVRLEPDMVYYLHDKLPIDT